MISKNNWNNCTNILCVRLDNLGDVLLTSPAIRALKHSNDKRKITLLTSTSGAQIAKYIPEIDEIIPFNVPWVKIPDGQINSDSIGVKSKKIFKLIADIKSRHFDAAVIFTNFSQNPLPQALICFLADIPKRLGYCRENPYRLLTDWVVDKEPFEFIDHAVIRQLKQIQTLGIKTGADSLYLRVPKDAYNKLEKKLRQLKINKNKTKIILHPGASELKRQYPPELFIKAAKILIRELNSQILITGVSSEKKLARTICESIGKESFCLAGELSLDMLIALLDTSDLLISNNTGLVHIASAVNTPVVVMYAHTNPEHTPWKVRSKILYFGTPDYLRSKNQLLKLIYPQKPTPMPQPADIVKAAQKLIL